MNALQGILTKIFTICILFEGSCLSFCPENNGILLVEESADPDGQPQSSKLYIATFINNTKSDISLEAVQMPGGYVGSGTFYNCLLEQWDEMGKTWNVARRVDIAGFMETRRRMIVIAPGNREEVCRFLLPHAAGSLGSCMRVRLEMFWKSEGISIISSPFVIGEEPGFYKSPADK